jgi:hypothetical protein
VDTLIYNDRVFADGELVEETNDYLVQDKNRNVWYFGETVDNYVNKTFKDHNGDVGGQPLLEKLNAGEQVELVKVARE